MMKKEVQAVESKTLSTRYEKRFVIVDKENGEILDDAQGYGYKSAQKAYAAWNYKNRDKSKDKERAKKRNAIKKWMREHKSFVNMMDQFAFEIAKGSWGKDDKFDAKFLREMLQANNLEVEFTAGELLNVWRSGIF